jgi:hypothetical protein
MATRKFRAEAAGYPRVNKEIPVLDWRLPAAATVAV